MVFLGVRSRLGSLRMNQLLPNRELKENRAFFDDYLLFLWLLSFCWDVSHGSWRCSTGFDLAISFSRHICIIFIYFLAYLLNLNMERLDAQD